MVYLSLLIMSHMLHLHLLNILLLTRPIAHCGKAYLYNSLCKFMHNLYQVWSTCSIGIEFGVTLIITSSKTFMVILAVWTRALSCTTRFSTIATLTHHIFIVRYLQCMCCWTARLSIPSQSQCQFYHIRQCCILHIVHFVFPYSDVMVLSWNVEAAFICD